MLWLPETEFMAKSLPHIFWTVIALTRYRTEKTWVLLNVTLMGNAKSIDQVSPRNPRRLTTVETFRYRQIFCVLSDNTSTI